MITLTPKKSALLSDTERLLQIAEALDKMKRRCEKSTDRGLVIRRMAYARIFEMYKNQLDKITSKI